MTALRKFLSLNWKERLLLLEAYIWLGFSRAMLLMVPFKRIAPRLGRQINDMGETPVISSSAILIQRIGWAVETMSRRTPWESACLAQAMAAKFMLRQRGLPSMLYLGTKKGVDGKLIAHAWLKVGDAILVGGADHETFVALSAFVDE